LACLSCDDAGFCNLFDKDLLTDTPANTDIEDASGSEGLDAGTLVGIILSVVIAGIGGIIMLRKSRKDEVNQKLLMQQMENLQVRNTENPAYEPYE
jgi:hypothetical protein